jgi:hypothetical protein
VLPRKNETKPAGFLAVQLHIEVMGPATWTLDDPPAFDEGPSLRIDAIDTNNRTFPQAVAVGSAGDPRHDRTELAGNFGAPHTSQSGAWRTMYRRPSVVIGSGWRQIWQIERSGSRLEHSQQPWGSKIFADGLYSRPQ